MNQAAHAERAHASLGASSSHRWIACPGSINAQVGLEDEGSLAAAEGTAAHEVGESCLRDDQEAVSYIGRFVTVGNHRIEVTEEMAEAVQQYVDYVRSRLTPSSELLIEYRFDISDTVGPEMFGTNDACIFDRATGLLEVIDYKHGRVIVEPEENSQLLYYAVGALTAGEGRVVEDVKLTIVQPRAAHKKGPVRSWDTDVFYLMGFIEDLKVYAEATRDPNAKRVAGDHCTFCKAMATCPEARKHAADVSLAEFDTPPSELPGDDIAAILEQATFIKNYVDAVQREAFQRLNRGEPVPGYKLVAKRATRKWVPGSDEEILGSMLRAQFELGDDVRIHADPKLLTPAQFEKLVPKKRRAELADFYEKTSSGNTMAREADAREEVAPSNSADNEFSEVD